MSMSRMIADIEVLKSVVDLAGRLGSGVVFEPAEDGVDVWNVDPSGSNMVSIEIGRSGFEVLEMETVISAEVGDLMAGLKGKGLVSIEQKEGRVIMKRGKITYRFGALDPRYVHSEKFERKGVSFKDKVGDWLEKSSYVIEGVSCQEFMEGLGVFKVKSTGGSNPLLKLVGAEKKMICTMDDGEGREVEFEVKGRGGRGEGLDAMYDTLYFAMLRDSLLFRKAVEMDMSFLKGQESWLMLVGFEVEPVRVVYVVAPRVKED